jgi:hypothetical protein
MLMGGLGNQLFQYCAGETIRLRTKRNVLYDCDRGFRDDPFGRRFELARLVPPERQAPLTEAKGIWRSPLQERFFVAVENHIMQKRGVCSVPLAASLAWIRWWPGAEIVFRSCFQLLEFVAEETVEQIRESAGLSRWNGEANDVAVHFRRVRSKREQGQASQFVGTSLALDYYRGALGLVRSELAPVQFRVYSDVGAIPGSVFSPSDTVSLDEDENPSPWTTLVRMARCNHFVVANSTFGWWAAYLSRGPGKRVYAPRNWPFTSGRPAQRGIFPHDWLLV